MLLASLIHLISLLISLNRFYFVLSVSIKKSYLKRKCNDSAKTRNKKNYRKVNKIKKKSPLNNYFNSYIQPNDKMFCCDVIEQQ